MKNTKTNEQPLIKTAVDLLLKNLGPEKTTQLWQIFNVSKIDYLKIKPKFFAGKSIATICKEAKQFNR
mgnify:CR=1 FL=1